VTKVKTISGAERVFPIEKVSAGKILTAFVSAPV
jgi:hypothetical protein